MIFEILDFNKNAINDEHRIVFENLACSFYEGRHFIFANRNTVEKILSLSGLSNRATGAFKKARNLISQIGSFIDTAKFKITINFKEKVKNIKRCDKHLQYSYHYFIESKALQNVFLLCENTSDVKVYLKIADFFLFEKQWKQFSVKFTPQQGGGGDTFPQFRDFFLQNPNSFCFCILDNDKPHPKHAKGSTAKAVDHSFKPNNGKVLILSVHELENLIPFQLFLKSIADVSTSQEAPFIKMVERLCELEKNNFNLICFIDLKNGMNCKTLLELDRAYGAFWKDTPLSDVGVSLEECYKKKNCCSSDINIFPRITKDIISSSIEKMLKTTCFKLCEIMPDERQKQWRLLGEELFWWGCAPKAPINT